MRQPFDEGGGTRAETVRHGAERWSTCLQGWAMPSDWATFGGFHTYVTEMAGVSDVACFLLKLNKEESLWGVHSHFLYCIKL